jgi:uncharacterized membrane protein YccC
MRAIAHLAAAALVLSLAACDDRREPKVVDDVESAANEAGEAVEGTARDLGDYTYAQRDEFRTEVRRHIAELDAEIEELGRDTGGAAGTVSADAMRGIRSAREQLDQSLGRVGEAAEDDWAELRAEVEQSMVRVREVIAEVRRTEGPMGGRGAGQT